jgi:site-specific recombinase XerD
MAESGGDAMSALDDALSEYLATRRALGTQLAWPELSLRKFVSFVDAEGAEFLTTELAMRWTFQSVGVQRATYARRLGIVRSFAVWLQATDSRTQVPPRRILPARYRRPAPHIYDDGELAALMGAAGQLRSASGLRGATFNTLIGLLAATGLRPGEAYKLDVGDVDLDGGIIAVRESKFNKSRFVPLEQSARDGLLSYAAFRDAVQPHRETPAFLITAHGARLEGGVARRHSPVSARRLACALDGIAAPDMVPGSKTFAIHSPRAGSSSGTAPISMWIGSCPVLPPTSVT